MQIRCPHCQNPIETVAGSQPPECPSCGNSLSVADDQTIGQEGGPALASDPATLEWGGNVPPPADKTVGPEQVHYFGEYELLDEIARGGMGVVYRARQTKLNRVVALKMILAGQLASPEDVQRFHIEAEAAANLEHPGIVPIYEIGEHQGQHFFSMGFIEGTSLDASVKEGPMSPREAAAITRQIAEAIAYAHLQGVIHRDLKPANILIDTAGEPRVTDFGLAKKTEGDSGLTGTGQILGTPGYMPPEQASGETDTIGPTADIYSLGAILYAVLTGRPPFQSANVMDTLVAVLEQEPVAPRQLNPELDADLETICLKCLEKDAGRRYQAAGELVDELDCYLSGKPITARPIGKLEFAWRWCKRKPAVAGAGSLAVILLLLLGVGGPMIALQQTQLRRKADSAAEDAKRATAKEAVSRSLEQEARERSEWLLYFHEISAAQQALRVQKLAVVQSKLEACRPLHRGWEHDFLLSQLRRRRRHFDGLRNWERAKFNSDGTRFLTLNKESVQLWDPRSEACLHTWSSELGHPFSIDFVNDKPYAIFFRPDGKTHIHDLLATNPIVGVLDGQASGPGAFVLSRDGRFIAKWTDDNVKVWSIHEDAGRLCLDTNFTRFNLRPTFFSPDATRLAVISRVKSGSASVSLFDVESGRRVCVRETSSRNSISTRLVFSPRGQHFAVAGRDGDLAVCDSINGDVVHSLAGHQGVVRCAEFSPDGNRLASGGSDGTVRVWDVKSGVALMSFTGTEDTVSLVHFSRSGERIVAAGDRSVGVWDTASGLPIFRSTFSTFVKRVSISSNGHRIVAGGIGEGIREVRVWDVQNHQALISWRTDTAIYDPKINYLGEWRGNNLHCLTAPVSPLVLASHQRQTTGAVFAPDGKWIATTGRDKLMRVWDPSTGECLVTQSAHIGAVRCIAVDPGGKYVVTGCESNRVRGEMKIWSTDSFRQTHTVHGQRDDILSLAFSPDGRILASGSRDRTIKTWSFDQGVVKELSTFRTQSPVLSVAFSLDGKMIVSSGVKGIEIFDATNGTKNQTLSMNSGGTWCAVFSSTGERLVSGGINGTIVIWDVKNGKMVHRLNGHRGTVTGVAYSPDDHRIVSSASDGTVRLWDPMSGQLTMILDEQLASFTSVGFSRDGKSIVAGCEDGTTKVWDARPLAKSK